VPLFYSQEELGMIIPTVCKRCGQAVFFYKNDHGSKVFFDEVGGKWPKHDCSGRFYPRVILIKKNIKTDEKLAS
jgi:hypothetical protein